jgi:4'-phosphopantetheinyl transferase
VVTRAVLRSILAKYLGTEPQHIEFTRNSYGKPFVKGANIEFNMSHSYNSAYYAITSDFSVGIDVEFYNKEKNIFNIAKSVFSNDELNFFLNLPTLQRQEFFFNAWTKKEAVIKAMGLGLAYPMEKVDTILEKRKGHIELSKDKYYLHALDTSRDYKAHLVAKNERDIVIDQQLFVV